MNIVVLIVALNKELERAVDYLMVWLDNARYYEMAEGAVKERKDRQDRFYGLLYLNREILAKPTVENMTLLRDKLPTMFQDLKYHLGDAWGLEQESMFKDCLTMKRIVKHIKGK